MQNLKIKLWLEPYLALVDDQWIQSVTTPVTALFQQKQSSVIALYSLDNCGGATFSLDEGVVATLSTLPKCDGR